MAKPSLPSRERVDERGPAVTGHAPLRPQVSFYEDEGAQLVAATISRGCDATCLAWQGQARVLATGWADGHVAVYTLSATTESLAAAAAAAAAAGGASSGSGSGGSGYKLDCVYADDAAHGAAGLRFMLWNPTSTRLVSGDGGGVVRVWKADGRGGLAPFKQYSTGAGRSPCTCAVFSGAGGLGAGPGAGFGAGAGKYLGASAFSPPFFFGSEEGRVFFADDLGHSAEVQSLASPVDSLLFYDGRSRLVILTRGHLLAQLQVSDDGRVTPVQKVKLSIAGDGVRQVCWAGPGLLAAATGEGLVRLWDLALDGNYTLPLAKPISRSDKVLSLSFNARQRYLACGTKEGKVALFRFVGPAGPAAAAVSPGLGGLALPEAEAGPGDWETMTPTAVSWKVRAAGPLGAARHPLHVPASAPHARFHQSLRAPSATRACTRSPRPRLPPPAASIVTFLLPTARLLPACRLLACARSLVQWDGQASVEVMGFGPGKGSLACGGAGGASVLREDVLHRVMRGGTAALQLTSQLVRATRHASTHLASALASPAQAKAGHTLAPLV